ncbi:MAG: hypothetical protein KAT29_09710 [Anaerolineales bacterium]|nr:hypothetical protein [Anaerolineales bacterium]
MTNRAMFEGLVVDELDRVAKVTYVGDEPCYVVDDAGFNRHIPSEQVDLQVLQSMTEMIEGHEDLISEQTAKMLGQEDIFSIAMISEQLKQVDQQFEKLLASGLPEETRAYLGMAGFKVVIDVHGEIVDIQQPGMIDPDMED